MAKVKPEKLIKNKLIYVFVLAVVFGIIAVTALRDNYIKMTQLRNNVAIVDEQNGDIEQALLELRNYVQSHMNTSLTSGDNAIRPPIQLKSRYERLQAVEVERVKTANAKIAADAESVCGARYPAGGFNPTRVACIQDYVKANAVKENSVSDSLYKFDFISPKWSPDLAGYSLLIFVVLCLWLVVVAIKHQIKKRYL